MSKKIKTEDNPAAKVSNSAPNTNTDAPLFMQERYQQGSTYCKEYYINFSTEPLDDTTALLKEQHALKIVRGEIYDENVYIEDTIKNWKTIRNNDLRDFISPEEFYEEVRKGAIGYKVVNTSVTVSEPTESTASYATKDVTSHAITWNNEIPKPYFETCEINTRNQTLPAYIRTELDNNPSNLGPYNSYGRCDDDVNYTVNSVEPYGITALGGTQENPSIKNPRNQNTNSVNLRIYESCNGGLELADEIKNTRTNAYANNELYKCNVYQESLWSQTKKSVKNLKEEPWQQVWINPDDRFMSIYPHFDKDILNDNSTFKPSLIADKPYDRLSTYFIPLQPENDTVVNTQTDVNQRKPYKFSERSLQDGNNKALDRFMLPLTIPCNSIVWNYEKNNLINFEYDNLKYTTTTSASPEPPVMAYRYQSYSESNLSARSYGFMKAKVTYKAEIEFIYRDNINTNQRSTTANFWPYINNVASKHTYLPLAEDCVFNDYNTVAIKRNIKSLLKTIPDNLVFLQPFKRTSINIDNSIVNAPTWTDKPFSKVQPMYFTPFNKSQLKQTSQK